MLELRCGPGRFPPSCRYRGRFIFFLCKLARTIDVSLCSTSTAFMLACGPGRRTAAQSAARQLTSEVPS